MFQRCTLVDLACLTEKDLYNTE